MNNIIKKKRFFYPLFYVLLISLSVFVFEFSFAGNILFYGNYGMIGYTGGQKPTDYFPTDFSKPAVDSMDELFKKHDQQYWAAKEMGGKTGRRFKKEADIKLLNGLKRLVSIGINNWDRKPSNKAYALTYLISAISVFKVKVSAKKDIKSADNLDKYFLRNKHLKKAIKTFETEFVYIQPGTFIMGSPKNEQGRSVIEKQHQVTLTRGFYLQTTEVTQAQWRAVIGRASNPSHFRDCGDDCPVERVTWEDVQEFINKLNQIEGSNKYRLPTEAEWEYACRAGTTTRFSFGDDAALLGQYAWYNSNSGGRTHPVGQKKPNVWGLYDMHGNVFEWVQDWHGDYPSASVTDPTGPPSGARRVIRGGGWGVEPYGVRSAEHFWVAPDDWYFALGFRLARNF